MANFNSNTVTDLAATPAVKSNVNRHHGRIRFFEVSYTVPASAGPQIGDTITWIDLPLGARFLGHLSELSWSTGAASSTLNLGDQASAARHLAATAVTTAGQIEPRAASALGLVSFETTDTSNTATDNCILRSTVAGAALVAAQVITLRGAYTLD